MQQHTPIKLTFYGRVKQGWNHAWKHKGFRYQAIITAVALACFPRMFRSFFDFVESRAGTHLNDPVLNLLPAHDVSWTVFFFLYSGVAICIYCNLHQPKYLLLSFQTYILVTLVRLVTITWFPLEPPFGYIPLREPIVQLVTNGGRIISKDLFFSGHVSTIMSLFLTVHHKQFRPILGMFVNMVALGVMIQHVHYTIDVLAAPVGTYLCYWVCRETLQKKLLW